VTDGEVGLAEAIEVLRSELRKAQDSGQGADVRFCVGSVEVELVVEVVKKAGGQASVNVLNVLSLGGKGGLSKGETNRVKVVLNPVGIGGAPFEVASARDRRPDNLETGGVSSSSPEESEPTVTTEFSRPRIGPPGG
jgi:Trypsin-co-occurring domain 2